jgi:hypothetical protein
MSGEGEAEVEGWTAEQWKANATYWYEQCQEAYRFRDMAAATAAALRAAAGTPTHHNQKEET